ncbi:MAG: hypothetical protein EBV15_07785 [Bacteroidetes bacterium]|nr:hypothetical protein [Bacteroidota bacterium]
MVVVFGVTLKLEPVPMEVPLHEPLYHFHVAPVPRLPPDTLTVVLWPLQILLEPAVTELAGTDVSRTVTL